jgi:hypothetical protein
LLPEHFVVPSKVVKEKTIDSKHPRSEFYSIYREHIRNYKDKWNILGDPRAELEVEKHSVSEEVKGPGDA